MTSTTTDRRYGVNAGVAIKAPCVAATISNITLSGEQTIDGIACVTGDRVFVKDQTTASENGIYVVDTGSWSRAPDFDDVKDVVEGTVIPVNRGTVNSDTDWRVTNTGTITPGTTSLTFENAAFSSSGSISFLQAGAGAVSRSVQSKLREAFSVTDFEADPTGISSSVTAFQNAINATTNSGVQYIGVPEGTYLGDMTTLTYGSRTVVFVEDGPVTYSTATPVASRIRPATNGLIRVESVADTTATPMALYGKLTIGAGAGSGLPWAILGVVESTSTDSAKSCVAVYAQGVAQTGATAPIWGSVSEVADSRPDNATYGTSYGTQPDTNQPAINAIEVDSVRTGPFNDSGTRAMGAQFVAFGGSESTNCIEIHAASNNNAATHDGTAQAGTIGTITLAADARASNDYYLNCLVTILTGTGAGQQRKITAYVGATKVATVDTNWTTTPDATSVYHVNDVYMSGMWRRGIRIYASSMNDESGEAFLLESNTASAFKITGNTTVEDFGVRRTTSNLAKMEFHTGVTANGTPIFTQNMAGGDSAAATSDITYADFSTIIDDNTNGAQYGEVRIRAIINGTLNNSGRLAIGDGVVIGSPAAFQGAGTLNIAGDFYRSNTKVVGARNTGWTAMTGTADKATAYDTATVTLAQLAGRVMSIQAALTTHGLIGA